jgi:DsbC/DsbD-like thiol-disulfide interchange protein
MRMFFCSMLFVLMAGGLGQAQSNDPVVEAHAVMAADAAHANAPLKIAVVAQVAAGYHINDHKPTLNYLIRTELKLEPSAQITVTNTVYPKGTLKRFSFSDISLSVYEGTVVVGVLLQVAKGVQPGSYDLKGKFAYQACNDHACFPPASVPLTLTIKVVPRTVPVKPLNSDVFERLQLE